MTQPLADRFLHVCYNCAATELDDTAALFTAALGLQEVMRSPLSATDGALLGFDGAIETAAVFLYDSRGPRMSPAIEVQGWQSPEVVSQPMADLSQPGIHAIGFAADDAHDSLNRLKAAGCVSVRSAPVAQFETRTERVRDPRGIIIEVVAQREATPPLGTHLAHIRIVCRDLAASVAWYERFGFRRVASPNEPLDGAMVRLCLAANDVEVVLMQAAPSPELRPVPTAANTRGLFRLATRVENLDAAIAALAQRGIAVVAGPLSVAIAATPLPDLVIAMVCDPDGIPYELVQRPAAAFRSLSVAVDAEREE